MKSNFKSSLSFQNNYSNNNRNIYEEVTNTVKCVLSPISLEQVCKQSALVYGARITVGLQGPHNRLGDFPYEAALVQIEVRFSPHSLDR